MHLIKITPRNNNGTLSLTIPADIVKELNLKKGDQFQVMTHGREIIATPIIA